MRAPKRSGAISSSRLSNELSKEAVKSSRPANRRLSPKYYKEQDSYPKPGAVGGRLIRQVIGFLKREGRLVLPISSHILIGVSGGPDSVALAHLLLKYGRRVAPREQIALLHVDHGWREESAKDARFVKAFAKQWGVPIYCRSLKSPQADPAYERRSWEDVARDGRKAFFEKMARRHEALVLTAHQADDLAETLLWRLFTGCVDTHGGGIAVRHGIEVRPFLGVRKTELLAYLKEEQQSYLVDQTNFEGRFLRSRIRTEILPAVEKLFPRAVEHLVRLGLDAQAKSDHLKSAEENRNLPAFERDALAALFRAAGISDRRAYWEALKKGQSQLDLAGGWKLTRRAKVRKGAAARSISERWMLERIFEPVSRRNGKGKTTV